MMLRPAFLHVVSPVRFSQGHCELAFLDGFMRIIAQIEFKLVALKVRIERGELRNGGPGEAEIIFVNFDSN